MIKQQEFNTKTISGEQAKIYTFGFNRRPDGKTLARSSKGFCHITILLALQEYKHDEYHI
jgi:hypothetical protein